MINTKIELLRMERPSWTRTIIEMEATGNLYRFKFHNPMMTRAKTLVDVARIFVLLSDECLHLSAMIRMLLENAPRDRGGAELRKSWESNARLFEQAAMAVPSSFKRIRTESDGYEFSTAIKVDDAREKLCRGLLNQAPMEWNGSESAFLALWGRNVFDNLAPNSSMQFLMGRGFHRDKNVPALVERAADAPERMRQWAVNALTRHIPERVPLRKAPPAVIRGDRAASLLNIIVPRIEAQIEAIPDADERRALRARIERLGDRVQIAAANRSQEAQIRDVRLSIETLEEQIDARLPALTA